MATRSVPFSATTGAAPSPLPPPPQAKRDPSRAAPKAARIQAKVFIVDPFCGETVMFSHFGRFALHPARPKDMERSLFTTCLPNGCACCSPFVEWRLIPKADIVPTPAADSRTGSGEGDFGVIARDSRTSCRLLPSWRHRSAQARPSKTPSMAEVHEEANMKKRYWL